MVCHQQDQRLTPKQTLRAKIQAARKVIPADLVLKNARVINVFSGIIQERDVAIHKGYIVGLGAEYQGKEEVDIKGKWVSPGLIDGHLHIESSMLLPSHLAAALLPHGTTAIVSDPHEIANVLGNAGILLMIRESQGMPFDIFFMAPSCVPATSLETSGARISPAELLELKTEPKILGLAEVMDFPGVLSTQSDVLEKLLLFQNQIIDGHGPSLRGYDLQAYLTAGIRSDHETSDIRDAEEKLDNGMILMIREGTSAKNMEKLLPAITANHARQVCLVSDDLHPLDICRHGHLDFLIKKAVKMGLDPVAAFRMVTLNPATYFGLRDRGAVAPGYRADLVIFEDLNEFRVDRVYKDGNLVMTGGDLVGFPEKGKFAFELKPLNLPSPNPEDFRIPAQRTTAKVIELVPGQILTGKRYERVKVEKGLVVSDTDRDILKLAVLERHKFSGRIGLGLVYGFGLKQGALASSIAHDSHNIIAVGVTDQDLCKAVEEVKIMGGGMVAIKENRVLARVPLPVAGIMSAAPLEELIPHLDEVNRIAFSLGCAIEEPFMALSFLALPVIPELKLTDMGLVDVNQFAIVPLFEDQ